MGCLHKEYKQNGKKPISFYHFVIDPTSFPNSVENMFYVSFLIKDGFVSISEGTFLPFFDFKIYLIIMDSCADGEDGLPTLNVIGRNRESSTQASVSKKQLIIALDQDMWQVS